MAKAKAKSEGEYQRVSDYLKWRLDPDGFLYFPATQDVPLTQHSTTVTWPVGYDDGCRKTTRSVRCEPWQPKHADPLDEATGYPKSGNWDWRHVLAALKEAMDILHRLPMPRDGRPRGYVSNMPEYVHEFMESYGSAMASARVAQKARPSSREIAWMDDVLSWLGWALDRREAIVMTGMAMGMHYRAIGKVAGCSHTHARRVGEQALERIAAHLNA